MPKTRRPLDPRIPTKGGMELKPTISAFALDITNDAIDDSGNHYRIHQDQEIGCFGIRGDGKTMGFLAATISHAMAHHANGFPLPVPWMAVTDTFTSHKLKTLHSLMDPIWLGGWRMSDQDHVAEFWINGAPVVHLDLFGVEDQGAMDRLRMASVGMWFEEPAPSAVMVQSSGISESAWLLGSTSCRVPSHFNPKVFTANYPDEDHWTWRRFVTKRAAGTRYYRIPPKERVSEHQWQLWMEALKDRPDLQRRLLLGQPGVVMLGDQVAQGFDYDAHVSLEPLVPLRGEPMGFGFDFGHTPTCVIGQNVAGTYKIYAALFMQGAGMKQLLDDLVVPWIGRNCPAVLRSPDDMALVGYDPSGEKGEEADIDHSALQMIKDRFGGGWYEPGPVRWPNRKDAILQVFQKRNGVLLDPRGCEALIKALNGRWYYPKSHQGELRSDLPKKPNHPWEDLGDAFIYLLCRLGTVFYQDEQGDGLKYETNMSHGG